MKLSTVIPAKNEEKNIRKALESVRFSNEIIVVDSGSTDRTLDIAKEFNAKIIQTTFENDFSKLRNKGFSEALGEWVLFLDSDEEITKELKENILSAVNNIHNEYSAYYLKRRDFMWGRELRFGETRKVRTKGLIRLARKQKGEWKGLVHEVFAPAGPVSRLQGYINHYPHKTLSEFLTNINTYSAIRTQEFIQSGRRVTIVELVTVPFLKFVYTYFLQMGFRDSVQGFIYAFFMSFHSFLVRAKVYVYYWKKESSH